MWARSGHVRGRSSPQSGARLLATFPADQVAPRVARIADRLGLEHARVTGAVVDAVSRDEDAGSDAWGVPRGGTAAKGLAPTYRQHAGGRAR